MIYRNKPDDELEGIVSQFKSNYILKFGEPPDPAYIQSQLAKVLTLKKEALIESVFGMMNPLDIIKCNIMFDAAYTSKKDVISEKPKSVKRKAKNSQKK